MSVHMRKSVDKLANGTGVRFNYLKSSGFQFVTEVQDGKIIGPFGEKKSPSGAAEEIDQILREGPYDEEIDGKSEPRDGGWSPSDWDWFSGDGWDSLKQPE